MRLEIMLTGMVGVLMIGLGELLWRDKTRHGEGSRKFTHILIGTFIAFWPFYLSWQEIRIISLIMIAGVVLSKYFNLVKTIHTVGRQTWGEIFFAVSVGALTFITDNPYIFAAAVLHMSLADGLAAIIGTKYGHANRYIVFGHTKSVMGSITFFMISALILGLYVLTGGPHVEILALTILPFITMLIENVAIRGVDNLFVPLLVAVALRIFS